MPSARGVSRGKGGLGGASGAFRAQTPELKRARPPGPFAEEKGKIANFCRKHVVFLKKKMFPAVPIGTA